MFEKLVESNTEGAEFKKRKSYFMVSSVVVGILFVTAVVISIYAADYSLGSASFELSQIVSPEDMTPAEPEPMNESRATSSVRDDQLPTRRINMASVNEPTHVPSSISTERNSSLSRPDTSRFRITNGPETAGSGSGRNPSTGGNEFGVSGERPDGRNEPIEPDSDPPPAIKPVRPSAPPLVKSMGVITGLAVDLPKPVYPRAAQNVGAQGKVSVQVLIDEEGRVVSAKAVNGNPLLVDAAVAAAHRARFTPTLLSKVPVKVTGVIVYNFTR